MADFRRWFTALAVVALFVGLASAQGGINGGGGTMNCATTTTVTPTVRSEGFTELVGDIVLNCTGGNTLAFGTQIPQANITVFLNTQVTSRILNTSSSNASEALLLIDEPGSATVSGYGPSLAQIPCSHAAQRLRSVRWQQHKPRRHRRSVIDPRRRLSRRARTYSKAWLAATRSPSLVCRFFRLPPLVAASSASPTFAPMRMVSAVADRPPAPSRVRSRSARRTLSRSTSSPLRWRPCKLA